MPPQNDQPQETPVTDQPAGPAPDPSQPTSPVTDPNQPAMAPSPTPEAAPAPTPPPPPPVDTVPAASPGVPPTTAGPVSNTPQPEVSGPQTPVGPTAATTPQPLDPAAATVPATGGVGMSGSTMGKSGSIKKRVGIIAAVFGGLFVVGFIAVFVMSYLGSGVPSYSELKDESLETFSGDTSISFKVPSEFQEYSKLSTSAIYVDYEDNEAQDSNATYAALIVQARSLPFGSNNLTQQQKEQVLDTLKEEGAVEDIESQVQSISSIKDLNITTKEINKEEHYLEISGEFVFDDGDEGGEIPGILMTRTYIGDEYTYGVALAVQERVWEKNQDSLNEVMNSFGESTN